MRQCGQSIVLIGFMGVGKSATGRSLARKTGLPLCDTDEILSARFGLPISEIFTGVGEKLFRDREAEIVSELPSDSAVIATGGGIVLRAENVAKLRKLGKIIWLDTATETLFTRISQSPARPLLQSENPRATFMALLEVREPLYRTAADVRLDSSNLTPDEAADAILRYIKKE